MKNGHLTINTNILQREFYNRDTLIVATELLGKYLVNQVGENTLIAKIVEVEAYLGFEDKASHTYGGRKTKRTKIMYGDPGYAYVYFTYGMHNLLNVVTRPKEIGEAVLFRAVEPVSNLDLFALNRFNKKYSELSNYQRKNLTNGPAKLTKAMGINLSHNGVDMTTQNLYILDNDEKVEIVESKRIGIDYSEEAKDLLYRFYIKNNMNISKK